jgi:hypothetical protein
MGFRTAIEFYERWLGRAHLGSWLYEKWREIMGAAMTIAGIAWEWWDQIRQNPGWMILILAAAFALVMVGLNQGLRILDRWRRSGPADAEPDKVPELKEIDLHQFLRFVGIDPMDRLPPSSNKAHDAFGKLRQLARDGKVRLKGKPGFKYRSLYMSWKPQEIIEPPYWRDAQIFSLDVLGASDVNAISTMPDEAMSGKKSEAFVYKELTIIQDDVKAHFKKDEFRNGN